MPERSDAYHLLGCAACGADTDAYRDDWREVGYIACSGDGCDAILTHADEGTWLPAPAQNTAQPPIHA